MQNIQEILNQLIAGTVITFVVMMGFDFLVGAIHLWKSQVLKPITSPKSDSQDTEIALDVVETPSPTYHKDQEVLIQSRQIVDTQIKPLLQHDKQMPKEEAVPVILPLPDATHTMADIDLEAINTINQKQARTLAKALGVQQKISGKNQSISWLREQIKKNLRNNPQMMATVTTLLEQRKVS